MTTWRWVETGEAVMAGEAVMKFFLHKEPKGILNEKEISATPQRGQENSISRSYRRFIRPRTFFLLLLTLCFLTPLAPSSSCYGADEDTASTDSDQEAADRFALSFARLLRARNGMGDTAFGSSRMSEEYLQDAMELTGLFQRYLGEISLPPKGSGGVRQRVALAALDQYQKHPTVFRNGRWLRALVTAPFALSLVNSAVALALAPGGIQDQPELCLATGLSAGVTLFVFLSSTFLCERYDPKMLWRLQEMAQSPRRKRFLEHLSAALLKQGFGSSANPTGASIAIPTDIWLLTQLTGATPSIWSKASTDVLERIHANYLVVINGMEEQFRTAFSGEAQQLLRNYMDPRNNPTLTQGPLKQVDPATYRKGLQLFLLSLRLNLLNIARGAHLQKQNGFAMNRALDLAEKHASYAAGNDPAAQQDLFFKASQSPEGAQTSLLSSAIATYLNRTLTWEKVFVRTAFDHPIAIDANASFLARPLTVQPGNQIAGAVSLTIKWRPDLPRWALSLLRSVQNGPSHGDHPFRGANTLPPSNPGENLRMAKMSVFVQKTLELPTEAMNPKELAGRILRYGIPAPFQSTIDNALVELVRGVVKSYSMVPSESRAACEAALAAPAEPTQASPQEHHPLTMVRAVFGDEPEVSPREVVAVPASAAHESGGRNQGSSE